MSDLKVFAVALVAGLLAFLLKDVNKRFSSLVGLSCGIGLTLFVLAEISELFGTVKSFFTPSSSLFTDFKTVLKCLGIGFVSSAAARLLNDLGEKGLSDKVISVGKVLILLTGLSLVTSFLGRMKEFLF